MSHASGCNGAVSEVGKSFADEHCVLMDTMALYQMQGNLLLMIADWTQKAG